MRNDMMGKYILVDREVVPAPDHETWGKWFEDHSNRRVAEDQIGEARVSTVFLGLDHGFEPVNHCNPPIVFETMIFGGKHSDYCERCCTWDEAVKMHKAAVELVKSDT
jgi:hypothetical protein